MKFGVIIYKDTNNLGDDIQTYAAARLLPQVDYFIDREHVDSFESEHGEPVAVPMNAWWFYKKWNWPPADCIIPLLTAMHLANIEHSSLFPPLTNEWLSGCGGEYLKAYGPVGCRDQATADFLLKNGIDAHFSGCLTLTLPKQKETEDRGTYACLVDLSPESANMAEKYLQNTGLEIRKITHIYDPGGGKLPEQRLKNAEKVLTIYQNARFVITGRLHAALPCLAMGIPVLAVVDTHNLWRKDRWGSYLDLVRVVPPKQFETGEFSFDFQNPPENRTAFLSIREGLLETVGEFVRRYQNVWPAAESARKTSYTKEEKQRWQTALLKLTCDRYMEETRRAAKERRSPLYGNLPMLLNEVSARIDLKNAGTEENDLEILACSDSRADIQAPGWFSKEGTGYIIKSGEGKLAVRLRCVRPGSFSLTLRGQYVLDENGKARQIWIDYTELAVNGRQVIKEPQAVWHNRPVRYQQEVSDGEIIEFSCAWRSHAVGEREALLQKISGMEKEKQEFEDSLQQLKTETVDLRARLSRLEEDRRTVHEKLRKTYEEKSEINRRLQVTYGEKAGRGFEIRRLTQEKQTLEAELRDLRNSRSFRLGRMLTWPLRKLRDLLRRKKN